MNEECSYCEDARNDIESANLTITELRSVIDDFESELVEVKEQFCEAERTCSNLRDLVKCLSNEVERLENIIQNKEYENEKLTRTVSTNP